MNTKITLIADLIKSKNVSTLDLSNRNLTEFPLEVFKLKNLRKLNLSNNNIKSIPQEISKLKLLETLDLSNNLISIFYAKNCNLRNLKQLNLNNNSLSRLPIQIENLAKLRSLSIANNKIKNLPNEFSKLSNLVKLNLSKNDISIFPEQILELKKLSALWLNDLKFQAFPLDEICEKLANLKSIYFFGHVINDSKIDENYRLLSQIKGNGFNEMILLKTRLTLSKTLETKSTNMMKKTTIFISYSHEDVQWLNEVKKNLKALSFTDSSFNVWDDTRIMSGEKWKEEIETGLNMSKIAILLVSTSFLASDFVQNNELPTLLSNAEKKGTIILPLIVGHSLFTKSPNLSVFQAVNQPEKPLNGCSKSEQDLILVRLAETVQAYLSRDS